MATCKCVLLEGLINRKGSLYCLFLNAVTSMWCLVSTIIATERHDRRSDPQQSCSHSNLLTILTLLNQLFDNTRCVYHMQVCKVII